MDRRDRIPSIFIVESHTDDATVRSGIGMVFKHGDGG